MSFADPSLPRAGSPGAQTTKNANRPLGLRDSGKRPIESDAAGRAVERPRGSSFRREIDWQHVGLLGAGLVIGALVGVGAALLLAPQSGYETRAAIGRKARFAKDRATEAWDDLADDLAAVTRRGQRRARRAMRRARWRASDAIA